MKNLITLLFAFFAFISISIAQSNNMKSYQRLQASVEYPAYQKSLKNNMISNAKAVKKSGKSSKKDDKSTARLHARVARIKGNN